jgi:hypothetical protein
VKVIRNKKWLFQHLKPRLLFTHVCITLYVGWFPDDSELFYFFFIFLKNYSNPFNLFRNIGAQMLLCSLDALVFHFFLFSLGFFKGIFREAGMIFARGMRLRFRISISRGQHGNIPFFSNKILFKNIALEEHIFILLDHNLINIVRKQQQHTKKRKKKETAKRWTLLILFIYLFLNLDVCNNSLQGNISEVRFLTNIAFFTSLHRLLLSLYKPQDQAFTFISLSSCVLHLIIGHRKNKTNNEASSNPCFAVSFSPRVTHFYWFHTTPSCSPHISLCFHTSTLTSFLQFPRQWLLSPQAL